MKLKSLRLIVLAMLFLFSLSGIVGAHATVYPRSMTADAFEKFVLRVPVEKEIATTQVRVEVPDGFTVSRVKPLAGWTYAFEKTADGTSVKTITWSSGQILPGEFQEFEFSGRVAKDPGSYAFRVFQTYAGGETVEWTGASGAKTPASFVEVKAGASGTDAHGAPTTPPSAETPDTAPEGTLGRMGTLAGFGGLLLGLLALVVAVRKR